MRHPNRSPAVTRRNYMFVEWMQVVHKGNTIVPVRRYQIRDRSRYRPHFGQKDALKAARRVTCLFEAAE